MRGKEREDDHGGSLAAGKRKEVSRHGGARRATGTDHLRRTTAAASSVRGRVMADLKLWWPMADDATTQRPMRGTTRLRRR
ncbi:methyltransferase domain-containing protein [Sesbania bispinosa]|nr:methyltransferase domain-containing protein [Sesbania bispinosa]